MQDHPVLGQVTLGYSPMIDRQRVVVASRLTIYPERPDAVPDAAALLAALDEVWPAAAAGEDLKLSLRPLDPRAPRASQAPGETASAAPRPPLSLNITGEGLLEAVMAIGSGKHRMIEVPAFMAADPAHAQSLQKLHASGAVMLIKGRPLVPLQPEVLACFAHSIVELSEDRRSTVAPPTVVRRVSSVYAGARTLAEAAVAFERGAVALLGWQFDDPAPVSTGQNAVPPDFRVVMELISGVDKEEPVNKLEAILKRDPTLAFRLMRYLNSPAFGLQVEVNSFGHALMLLGYQRLKRWLLLLLASSTKDTQARPLVYAAVRRGLIMEELARPLRDSEKSGEMFICGVFSLLDRLLGQPFEDLLRNVPVPERVQQTLRGEGGPYLAYLNLVRAIESDAAFDIREHAERLLLSQTEVNVALLRALRSARDLD